VGRFSASGTSDISGCLECNSGKYSATGSAYCNTAAAGYKTNDGRTAAVQCLAGTASPGAVDICTECDGVGEYSDSDGSNACKTAPAGFKPLTDRTNVETCPVNTFSTGAADICEPCEGGHSQAGGE